MGSIFKFLNITTKNGPDLEINQNMGLDGIG
jgi:hypothetical protein